ncbi:MAG: hypothetical protein WC438_04465 [Candidatus Pacearchaeota archaeon]
MNPDLKKKIEQVNASYQRREKEARKIWRGYDNEVSKLTGIVAKEFRRVLDEIDLHDSASRKIEIPKFNVNYIYEEKCFDVEIREWGVNVDGTLISDRNNPHYQYCAYEYLKQIKGAQDEINPKIIQFQKDFNVGYIFYDCQCGSDHK